VQRGIEASVADTARLLGFKLTAGAKTAPTLAEYQAMARGIRPAYERMARNFLETFRDEVPAMERQAALAGGDASLISELAGSRVSIQGKLGRSVRVPTRTLGAIAEAARGLWGTLDAYCRSYRIAFLDEKLTGEAGWNRVDQLANDLGSTAWEESLKYADRLGLQDTNTATKAAGAVRNALNAVPNEMAARSGLDWLAAPIGTFILPVTKMPANAMVRGLEKAPTPLMAMQWLLHAKEYKTNPALVTKDIGNALVAAGLTAAITSLMGGKNSQPMITGSAPHKRGERDLDYRTAPPNSIRIGDTWYDYSRIEPYATTLGGMVDAIDQGRRTGPADAATAFSTSVLFDQLQDKTFLKGLGDLMAIPQEYARDGNDAAKKAALTYANNFATSWIPNIIRGGAKSTDPLVRDQAIRPDQSGSVLPSAAERAAQKALPIAELAGPAKVDLWGREISAKNLSNPAADFLYRLVSPVAVRDASNVSDLDRLIVNYNNSVAEDSDRFFPELPSATIQRTVGGQKTSFRLSDQEYHDFLVIAGENAAQRLLRRGLNADTPTAREIEEIKGDLEKARHQAGEFVLTRRAQQAKR
jgi:hypothetical protein